jgi:hypothetical protein
MNFLKNDWNTKRQGNNPAPLFVSAGADNSSKASCQRLVTRCVVLVLLYSLCIDLPAQEIPDERDSVTISANLDFVSQYIWRGQLYSNSPCIQPGFSVTWKDFELGAWGSYEFAGLGDHEADFYLSKSIGFVAFEVWDYWCISDTMSADFFDYHSETGNHLLEAQIILTGNETLPLNLLGSYFFYGADSTNSLYFELQYQLSKGSTEVEAFAGYQARGSFYAEKPAFVNIGCTVTKTVHITPTWEMPVSVSLIYNPDTKNINLVAGITL